MDKLEELIINLTIFNRHTLFLTESFVLENLLNIFQNKTRNIQKVF